MGMMTRWLGVGGVVLSVGLAFAGSVSTTTTTGASTTTGVPTTTVTTTSGATTTTTLFGGCVLEVSFTSVLCRLDALVAYVNAATDLGRSKGQLASSAAKARRQCGKASDFGTGKKASNQLKKCAKTIDTFRHKLDSHSAKQIIPAETRSFLRNDVAAQLHSDVNALR